MAEALFVARERELSQLEESLDGALAGQGQVCFVTGEAGSGKTALVGEFARRAQQAHPDLLVAVGNCNAQTGLGDPYLPFREVLGLLFGDVEDKLAQNTITAENASRLQGFLVHSGEVLVDIAPDLVGALVPGSKLLAVLGKAVASKFGWMDRLERLVRRKEQGSPESAIDPQHIVEQYTRALTVLAGRQPLIVVLDDLQWADAASVHLLFHLGRQIAHSRVLLIGCYRPADVALGRGGDRHPLDSVVNELRRYHGDIAVDLNAATEHEGRRFVDALLDSESNLLGEAFRARLFQRTGGHALFTLELLRDMEERGDLQRDETGRWVEGPSLDWDDLPARVESVIQERLDRLDETLREALTVASVEGIEFTAEVVAQVQGVDARMLVRRLSREAVQTHQLLRDLGVRHVGSQRLSLYGFLHNLFQAYLYQSLGEAERAYLHEDVGRALEALHGDHAGRIAVQLARHFEQAGIADKAIDYLCQAGEQAQALHAPLDAVGIFTRGLEMAERLSMPAPPCLLEARAEAYQTLGEFNQAQADYQAALEQAAQIGDVQVQWEVLLGQGRLWASRDYARSGEYLQQALALARELDDPATIAHSLNFVGNWQVNIGQPRQALRYHNEALEVFRRLDDRRGLAETYDLLGMASYLSGDMLRSKAYYDQAIASFRELDDERGLAASLALHATAVDYITATVVADPEGPSRCKETANTALEMARKMNWRSGEAYALLAMGMCLGPQGEYKQALLYAREGLRLAREIEHHQWTCGAHCALGALYLDLLAYDLAREHLQQALEMAEHVGSQYWLWSSSALLASTHIAEGHLEQAEATLATVIRLQAPYQTLAQRLAWCVRGEWALAAGDATTALQIADQLIASAANLAPQQAIPRLSKLRGQALAALGKTEEAQAELEAALASAQGAPPLAWRIHAALGRLYADSGRAEQAKDQLAAARQIVEQLAAKVPDQVLREGFVARAAVEWQER